MKRFLKWAGSSWQGHIALGELLVTLPLLAVALSRLIGEHLLTPKKCVYVVFLAAALGIIFAVLFWLVFTRPARRSVGNQS